MIAVLVEPRNGRGLLISSFFSRVFWLLLEDTHVLSAPVKEKVILLVQEARPQLGNAKQREGSK